MHALLFGGMQMDQWKVHILCILLSITAQSCMAGSMTNHIGKYVDEQIKQDNYTVNANSYQLNKELLAGWILEKVVFRDPPYQGPELYYRDNYAGKKELLLDVEIEKDLTEEKPQTKPKLENKDVKTYWMVYSFSHWLKFIELEYDIPPIPLARNVNIDTYTPRPSRALFYLDQYSYRLINPLKTRAYDVIFMVAKKDDFVFKTHEGVGEKEKQLLTDYEETRDKRIPTAVQSLYRHASFISSIETYSQQNYGYQLLQLRVKRTIGGRGLWSVLHDDRERRVRDTYIFILTGAKVKLIIQTFCHPDTSSEEIEQELKLILNSIIIK